jgi:uncharacterized membrane protein
VNNLVAIAYEDVDQAQQVLSTLGGLAREHALELADAVVVERQADGKIKLHQPSSVGTGVASGAVWGGLIGMLFLMPFFGMALGAASGAAAGATTDVGIDDDFMRELATKLEPGGAAVMALVSGATLEKVLPALAAYGGHVMHTSLSSDQEQALQAALTPSG